MDIMITLSANAGVSIEIDHKRILIDAFPGNKTRGFSCVSEEYFNKLITNEHFMDPDLMITSHRHADHFSAEYDKRIRELWPNMITADPGETGRIELDGITVKIADLPHEGSKYSRNPHSGILISCRGRNILIPADCAIGAKELTELIEGIPVDVALLDFPWITLRRGRKYIEETMQPRELIIYHIPFPEDDINHYREAVNEAVNKALPVLPLMAPARIRILADPRQTEIIKL